MKIVQVDAFTDEPFRGNPAAVCVMKESRDESWMQKVAAEMNLAETAFLFPEKDGYRLRWFTPAVEIDLCGHATLASAHVLWQDGYLPKDQQARFYTRSGLLTASRDGDWIEMDFPSDPPEAATAPSLLTDALRVRPLFCGTSRFDYLVEVESEEIVRKVSPNLAILSKAPVRGTIITSRGSAPYDFVSRFFAPSVGVNEDPVTGSAHCCLAPYWSKKLGKKELLAYQASPRGGTLQLRVDENRVKIRGKAVTVLQGELLV